jgi:hypothetical protein
MILNFEQAMGALNNGLTIRRIGRDEYAVGTEAVASQLWEESIEFPIEFHTCPICTTEHEPVEAMAQFYTDRDSPCPGCIIKVADMVASTAQSLLGPRLWRHVSGKYCRGMEGETQCDES